MRLLDLLDSEPAMFCILASIVYGVCSALWFIYGNSVATGVLGTVMSFVFYLLACNYWLKLERYQDA